MGLLGDPVQLHQQGRRFVVGRHRLAEYDQALVVDREFLPGFLGRRDFRSVLGQRAFDLRHLRVELVRFLTLRAQDQDPESGGDGRDDEHRADDQVRLSLGLDLHQPSAPSSEPSLEAASVVAVTVSSPSSGGTGAASNATTRLNAATSPEASQPPPPPLGAPLSSEDSTPTRVTPSMSSSAVTKPATASWPLAHPLIAKAGPFAAPRRADPEEAPSLDTEALGVALAWRLVSHTSPGSTSASSRITRSQSKRLSARLLTVAIRCSARA